MAKIVLSDYEESYTPVPLPASTATKSSSSAKPASTGSRVVTNDAGESYNYVPYTPKTGSTTVAAGSQSAPAQTSDYTPTSNSSYSSSSGSRGSSTETQKLYDNYDNTVDAFLAAQLASAMNYNAQQQANLRQQQQLQQQAIRANVAASKQALQSAYENAQPMYDQLARENEIQKAKALGNASLRAEAQGNRGGIGQKQFSDQQAAYDARLTNIRLQQMNLYNETQAQIAQLEMQGRYEEAKVLADIANTKMNMLQQQYQQEYQMQYNLFNQGLANKINMGEFIDNSNAVKYSGSSGRSSSTGSVANNVSDDAWQYLVYLQDKYGEDAVDAYLRANYKNMGYSNADQAKAAWQLYGITDRADTQNQFNAGYTNLQPTTGATSGEYHYETDPETGKPVLVIGPDIGGPDINRDKAMANSVSLMIENAYKNGTLSQENALRMMDALDAFATGPAIATNWRPIGGGGVTVPAV